MDDSQKFKLAVLTRLLNQGMTLDEVREKVGQLATAVRKNQEKFATTLEWRAVRPLLAGAAIPVAAAATLGPALGYFASNMTDPPSEDKENLQAMEKAEKYRQLANQLRLRQAANERQQVEAPAFSRL